MAADRDYAGGGPLRPCPGGLQLYVMVRTMLSPSGKQYAYIWCSAHVAYEHRAQAVN